MSEAQDFKEKSIGLLCLSFIPYAIVAALLVGLMFITGVVDFGRYQKLYERRNEVAGVTDETQKSKVALIIDNSHSCLKIESAELNGSEVDMILRNDCHKRLTYYQYKAKAQGPNGLYVSDDWSNQGPDLEDGEKTQVSLGEYGKMSDDRAAKIVVYVDRVSSY